MEIKKKGLPRNKDREKEVLFLYYGGTSQVDIAKIYGCTRQRISQIVRRHSSEKETKNILILSKTCPICGYVDHSEIKTSVLKNKRIKNSVCIIQKKAVCKICMVSDIFKCRKKGCGHVGPKVDFVKGSVKRKIHTGMCKPCNAKDHMEYFHANTGRCLGYSRRWQKENPEYFKEYAVSHRKEIIAKQRRRSAERRSNGLCVFCGKVNVDKAYRNCPECRKRSRERWHKTGNLQRLERKKGVGHEIIRGG